MLRISLVLDVLKIWINNIVISFKLNIQKIVATCIRLLCVPLVLFLQASVVLAADSYRYLHVSIDTPWAIFVFLLLIILFPFVLSAILYWYFTFKKHKEEKEKKEDSESPVETNNS